MLFNCPTCIQEWHLFAFLLICIRPFFTFIRSFFLTRAKKESVVGSDPEAEGIYFGTVYSLQDWTNVETLTQKKRLLVVKYSADYCRPCHLIAPEYQSLAKMFNGVFCDLDVNNSRLAQLCEGVHVVPTFAVFSCVTSPSRRLVKFEGADLEPLRDFLRRYSTRPLH